MSTPAELREQSRLIIETAKAEPVLEARRLMARQAFALAQLAEKIERDEAAGEGMRAKSDLKEGDRR
jgi:hypothetical protein